MDCTEAFHILEPYFDELKEWFEKAGVSRIKHTRLRCAEEMRNGPRHFAGCLESGKTIFVAPELAQQDRITVLGILAHELGHATDFLYPGEWLLRFDKIQRVRADKLRLQSWKRRDADAVEITADLIGQYILGIPIGYRGPCQLQALGVSDSPRPLGLR